MSRYVSRLKSQNPAVDSWDCRPNGASVTVYTSEDKAVPTGLFDKYGNELWRVPEPIGLIRKMAKEPQ